MHAKNIILLKVVKFQEMPFLCKKLIMKLAETFCYLVLKHFDITRALVNLITKWSVH